MQNNPIIPIILSGGSGTRLWPLSRKSFPKQYIPLTHESEKSLLQLTYERLIGLNNLTAPIVICNEEHRFIVAEQFREIKVALSSIILEPSPRNTAPAIALAALKSLEIDEDPILLILSSDHKINDPINFREVIKKGIKPAQEGKLVVFGVVPNSPETGYGYIKSKIPLISSSISCSEIEKFVEKPNLKNAKEMIKDKSFLWNSGIFLFKASSILNELRKFYPDILKNCSEAIEKEQKDLDFQRIDEESFKKCESISIDYAVFEKTKLGQVLPLEVGWSDLGNWNSIWEQTPKTAKGNSEKGNVLLKESKNCYFRSEERLLVGIGLKNIIAIETSDAILVVENNHTKMIKNLVQDLNEKGIEAGQTHQKIYRPWGYYKSISEGNSWKVKEICVNPKASLSLQKHNFRSEHWVVVSGEAKAQIGSNIFFLKENESIYIPQKEKHKLTNPSEKLLKIIEVQNGSYLGEDDIERFEDLYGRVKDKK